MPMGTTDEHIDIEPTDSGVPDGTPEGDEVGQIDPPAEGGPAPRPADTPDADASPDGDPGDDDDPVAARLRGEAAKWRSKLREAEGERDALAERLTAAQRREVESHAAGRLAQAEDVWLDDLDLDAVLDDEGGIDVEKVDAHLADLLERRPGLATALPGEVHRQPRSPLTGGTGELFTLSRGRDDDRRASGWSEVLRSGR